MNETILNNLKILKKKYQNIGFLIIGVFGSHARGDETVDSDIDILYDINEKFLKNYGGWGAVMQMESIKEEIKSTLHIQSVDLASADNRSKTFQHIIQNELIYV
jgi:predicted nucleotidyltransferase